MKRGIIIIIIIFCYSFLRANLIKLNEIYYDHPGGDTGFEWIELYNHSADTINLHNWSLEKAGTEFNQFYVFPDMTIEPFSFLLIGEENIAEADIITDISLQNGGSETDGIRIISSDNDTIDTILYDYPNSNHLPGDSFNPGIYFANDTESGHSLCRYPDGHDTNNCQTDLYETPIFTPGKPNKVFIDMGIEALCIAPTVPDSTQNVLLKIFVKNFSAITICPDLWRYEIKVNNSVIGTFNASDSVISDSTLITEHNLNSFSSGYYSIEVSLKFSDDNIENNNKKTSFLIPPTPLIVNEIMYKPSTNNVEWIEIYNRSQNKYKICNWMFKDSGNSWVKIIGDYELNPQKYIIITVDSITLYNFYEDNFSSIETNDWCNLNNTTPDIVLWADSNKTIIDSVYYDPGVYNCDYDQSIERINPFQDSLNNWEICEDSMGATPGTANSITPLDFDILVSKIEYDISNLDLSLEITVKNIGYNDISNIMTRLFFDDNYDKICQNNEIIDSNEIYLGSEEEKTIHFELLPPSSYKQIGFLAETNCDMNLSNNQIFTSVSSTTDHPVCINEIMYDPNNSEPEWIEIYNSTDFNFPIHNLKIYDKRDTITIQSSDKKLFSNHYLILVSNFSDSLYIVNKYYKNSNRSDAIFAEGLPSLNNSTDDIVLLDNYNSILDSLTYENEWGEEKNNSLERINPKVSSTNYSNWESSVSDIGATPGKTNSLFIDSLPSKVDLFVTPNPLSLLKKKSVLIQYNLPELISKINIRIFDIKGRLIKKIVDQDWVGANGSIIWNCKNYKDNVMPVGIYIIHLEAAAKQNAKIYEKTATMVIGEK